MNLQKWLTEGLTKQPNRFREGGAASPSRGTIRGILWLVVLLSFSSGYYFGSAVDQQFSQPQTVAEEAASGEVIQYGYTARTGTPTEVCRQAGVVADAYLDALDEAGYKRWKQIEKHNCAHSRLR
jgi:hypothetical protein